MTRYKKYKRAFRIACELLTGYYLYGYDVDTIFKEIMDKEGVVCADLFEKFILEHLDRLSGRGADDDIT